MESGSYDVLTKRLQHAHQLQAILIDHLLKHLQVYLGFTFLGSLHLFHLALIYHYKYVLHSQGKKVNIVEPNRKLSVYNQ